MMEQSRLLFIEHVTDIEFQLHEVKGYWGIAVDPQFPQWPIVKMWVKAPQKIASSGRVYLCFDLSGYPAVAPTSIPWDIESNSRLSNDKWPKDSVPGSPISVAFNPNWLNGVALYLPCDRKAIMGHDPWRTQCPEWYWQATFKINKYLQCVYETLRTGE